MRTAVVLVIVGAMAGVLASADGGQATAQASAAPSRPGMIRGRVTAADTGRPLRRARVALVAVAPSAGTYPITAGTSASGQFEVRDVPPGLYFVSASRGGYLTVQYGQRRPREKGVAVQVRDGETVERIDLVLPRGGVLAGTVVDELGEPYPGVRVDALALGYLRGRRVPRPAGVETTDDLGSFRIAGLEPGDYYLNASSAETWQNEKRETFGYASTYFPGGPIELAQAIALGTSEVRPDLHLVLQASRTVRVAGRVLRESGEPVAAAAVSLAYSYPGVMTTEGMRSVRTEADGSFEFKNVAGGMYRVGTTGADERITVGGADITDLVLMRKTGSTVLGSLLTDEGSAPPFGTSGVRVRLDAPYGNVLATVRVVDVGTDWSFKLTNLGGPFLFGLMGIPEGWMVESVRLGDEGITDTPWDVPAGGRELSGLRIVVTQKVGSLSGSVVDAGGNPTPAATIVIFPDDADLWIPYSRRIRTTRPGADGNFSIKGLPAGTYLAVARAFIEDGQWEEREFLGQVRAEAVRFTLEEGASETVTLKLPKQDSPGGAPPGRGRNPVLSGNPEHRAVAGDRSPR